MVVCIHYGRYSVLHDQALLLMKFLKIIIVNCFMLGISVAANAQCAMCRATVENSISKGHVQFAASLNTGIMYLFLTPYLLAGAVAFFWFRNSKKSQTKNSTILHIRARR